MSEDCEIELRVAKVEMVAMADQIQSLQSQLEEAIAWILHLKKFHLDDMDEAELEAFLKKRGEG